jgi:hypothetical protein
MMDTDALPEIDTTLFESIFRADASYEITLNRRQNVANRDEYAITVIPLRKDETIVLNETDAWRIITSGSQWVNFVGWYSYFGSTAKIDNTDVFIVGVETARSHPSRGAYLYHKSFVFPYGHANDALVTKVGQMARELQALAIGESSTRIDYGFNIINSQTPENHRVVEAEVFDYIARIYPSKGLVEFRTLVMTQAHIGKEKLRSGVVVVVPDIVPFSLDIISGSQGGSEVSEDCLKQIAAVLMIGGAILVIFRYIRW